MLILYETAAGFGLFKVLDEGKLKNVDSLHEEFASSSKAQKFLQLQAFFKFEATTDALSAATALVESKLSKSMRNFLKESIVDKGLKDKLMCADSKLASTIKEKLSIRTIFDNSASLLTRGIREHFTSLVSGVQSQDLKAMSLGLSHSIARYKLKFSPEKVDTMIVQAISLLDDLDKELNTYSMRVKEWYGWHFPEMTKIVNDNQKYAQIVLRMGVRTKAPECDFSDLIDEETEKELKESAQISMGTEINEEDVLNINMLCQRVISIANYRLELFEYLQNRMKAIAPNLTALVGDLVGARLIAHAGSLMNLAKYPASTVQILGAEKALFRALKTKRDTPKYGLIYHASLIGQTQAKFKGKIARATAAKCALSIRVDALGEKDSNIGEESKAKLARRVAQLEGGAVRQISGQGKSSAKTPEKHDASRSASTPSLQKSGGKSYNAAADSTLSDKKRKAPEAEAATPAKKKKKTEEPAVEEKKPKKKAKEEEAKEEKKKDKKKKKAKKEEEEEAAPSKKRKAKAEVEEEPAKKKKKKSKE
eukprot:gnl/Hemi2/6646_TR2267_c0_g1_i1.p1 gnl/Hemi2/6646_TR2267_c0_g1~~gnl/Hemi2/6646_TR2267_c0_g1_i1.p1  ORF type:complete len:537 (-),score=268.10 gnl/Hemi2/6646_TR2267_c0_g1_i1:15-1625(-)